MVHSGATDKYRLDGMNTTAALAPADIRPRHAAGGDDVVLRALIEQPFSLREPAEGSSPFIFSSPHSGRTYPPSFLAASRLDRLALRRSEDAFVDELFTCAPSYGAWLIHAHFPRAYVDANRAENEIDPAMFGGAPPRSAGPASARVAAGLGVIPKVVRDGMEIYGDSLPADEAEYRLEKFYRPYHAALQRLVAQAKARHGKATVIDCHSMPPLSRGYDIVLGDRHGQSCDPELSGRVEAALTGVGFAVGRNSPYAGGHTTGHYGRPGTGVNALQIEVNRGLYLDEGRMAKSDGFEDCRAALERFVAALIGSASG